MTLPRADRIAHLLLALRADETGFATVANLTFSGARWRIRRVLDADGRAGLDAACTVARSALAGGAKRSPPGLTRAPRITRTGRPVE